MLTGTSEAAARPMTTALHTGPEPVSKTAEEANVSTTKPSPITKMLRVEWLGQTAASLCWIASVFTYGITSTGDWLQLGAASAWLIANIASVVSSDSE